MTDPSCRAQADVSAYEPPRHRPVERELGPRLLPPTVVPTVVGSAASRADGAGVERADSDAFLAAVLGDAEDGAIVVVRALLDRGVSVQTVYLDLLAPTATALGELWNDDACGFVEVTVALGRLQQALRALSRIFISGTEAPAPLTGRALLSCIPGEQHTLGLFMVAEFLIRDGWGVSVGPPILESDLLQLLRDEWFDVIGFSVTCDSRLSRLQREIRRVRTVSRNARIGILVGGRVFNDRPELVARVGADASAADASGVPALARRLVARPAVLRWAHHPAHRQLRPQE
ncbi:MAG: cobalamin B12-binding domain-containing protein [Gemmatirosa sp.]